MGRTEVKELQGVEGKKDREGRERWERKALLQTKISTGYT